MTLALFSVLLAQAARADSKSAIERLRATHRLDAPPHAAGDNIAWAKAVHASARERADAIRARGGARASRRRRRPRARAR